MQLIGRATHQIVSEFFDIFDIFEPLLIEEDRHFTCQHGSNFSSDSLGNCGDGLSMLLPKHQIKVFEDGKGPISTPKCEAALLGSRNTEPEHGHTFTSLTIQVPSPECRDLEEPLEGCEFCDGEGEYEQRHTIPWDQIKFIYSQAIAGLARINKPL